MDSVLTTYIEQTKLIIENTIKNIYKKPSPPPEHYSEENLNEKIEKFFKKQKNFLNNKQVLYFEFKKSIYDIIKLPYYISLFYSNLGYIQSSIIDDDWSEILDIYEKVIVKNKNYTNSCLTDDKPIYDRRFLLLVIYYIFLIFVYILSSMLYVVISNIFHYIINILNVSHNANATCVLFIIYMYFILGIYYGGIPFIIATIILAARIIYFMFIILYYILYYIFYILSIFGAFILSSGRTLIGGKKKPFKGGDFDTTDKLIKELNIYINNFKKEFDNFVLIYIINYFQKFINYITPVNRILNNKCSNTSNIEQMLARHNSVRNTDEPVNINNKINEKIKEALPTVVRNNKFIKCMYKNEPKKPPPKCEDL